MEKINIPHTDLKVSRLAMGCMGLGGRVRSRHEIDPGSTSSGPAHSSMPLKKSASIFRSCQHLWPRGRSEGVFGRILRERPSLRDRIIIQSNAAFVGKDDPPGTSNDLISAAIIFWKVMPFLVDWHRPPGDSHAAPSRLSLEREESPRLSQLLPGKVLHFGVSNQNRFQMEYLQSFLPFSSGRESS